MYKHFPPARAIRTISVAAILACLGFAAAAQPNDNCANASAVAISNGGYGIGTFTSAVSNLTSATVESGEAFAPALFAAGQSRKSVWYRFSLPAHRSIRVTLQQQGTDIAAGDVGFAVYKASSCLPGTALLSTQLTPIGLFGNSFHPCVEPGDYLVQVCSKQSANGNVYLQVASDFSTAAYDHPQTAYNFNTLAQGTAGVQYAVDCQSLIDSTEYCRSLHQFRTYTKSTWHVFTTPNYFDAITMMLAPQSISNVKVGFRIYEGDVRSQAFGSLPVVDGCDSLVVGSNYGYPVTAGRTYSCDRLSPNRTYSVQLLFPQGFIGNVGMGFQTIGTRPTQAPRPVLSAIPASNSLGALPTSPAGVATTATDYFACNARHSLQPCAPATPAAGITVNGYRYNLSTFFRFTLTTTTNLSIGATTPECTWIKAHIRVFNRDLTNNCADLTDNALVGTFNESGRLDCLPPGNYTLQVMGVDSLQEKNWWPTYGSLYNYSSTSCIPYLLGQKLTLTLTARSIKPSNRFSLAGPTAVDRVNVSGGVMQPLVPGVKYVNTPDTFGCANTVLPVDTCQPGVTKAIYRQFKVADSGALYVFDQGSSYYHSLYLSDAAALADAQQVRSYPQRISGLSPVFNCKVLENDYRVFSCSKPLTCVVPGTYTLVSFGTEAMKGQSFRAEQELRIFRAKFDAPDKAESLGDINQKVPATGGSVESEEDYFTCKDNLVPINGYVPCSPYGVPYSKAIYRQFYISAASKVGITRNYYNRLCSNYNSNGTGGCMSLFSGKISDGVASIRPMPASWQNFSNTSTSDCNSVLQPGWYTLISLGGGPSYSNTQPNGPYQVGESDKITLTIAPDCAGPQYNRPHKAAIDRATNQPFLIEWGPTAPHSAAYPKTHRLYTLPTENFNCTVDTPFSRHPIPGCAPDVTRVAYYVFRTTQESYLEIDPSLGNWGGRSLRWAALYPLDVRKDSALFPSTAPIQPCIQGNGQMQICRAQPGVYTLVVFGYSHEGCGYAVTPRIYIDDVGGTSRFDHARNAYDFGLVPSDSTYYSGRPGDVNPLNPGRAPSNDFFYCSTGSQASDPDHPTCNTVHLPSIYQPGANVNMFGTGRHDDRVPRRNLWYTFRVRGQGRIQVRVSNKTDGKSPPISRTQYRFAVYRSDVNGNLSFSDVVAGGQVDSTLAQGLTYITSNPSYNSQDCSGAGPEVAFSQETCDPTPVRYYVLVESTNPYNAETFRMAPNSQVEVSVLVDTEDPVQPKFDHFAKAGNIGTGLGPGLHAGETDYTLCATRATTDPFGSGYNSCARKTLWYKFSSRVNGVVQWQMMFRSLVTGQSQNWSTTWSAILLFREKRPGDSTAAGLELVNAQSNLTDADGYWDFACVQPGETYYLLLPNCYYENHAVIPRIKLVDHTGDRCSAPVTATLPGAGSAVATALVDCHTIGNDYGEFNPTLTCPPGALRGDYKTSWFRVQITGRDTLDLTTYITENTDATSAQIKYRLMNGNCGAMQERSCVQDALTQDTYKCLAPGEYFVQVFTPVNAKGTVALNLSAVKHRDTCAPAPPCLVSSAFLPRFDCNTTDSVSFENLSTFGSDIEYRWDFGHAGRTSTAVSPYYRYPALATSQTYTVKLVVTNTACNRKDSSTATVTIPARPPLDLGPDRIECTPGTYTLDATGWPGSTYRWQNGSTSPTLSTSSSTGTYWVAVTFNGCTRRDTIDLSINPIQPRSLTRVICDNGSAELTAGRSQGEEHLWSTGSTGTSLTVSTPGLYTDRITWRGCIVTDSFRVISPPLPFAGRDTVLCHPMPPVTLRATVEGAQSYTWENGAGGAQRTVSTPGTYRVDINFGNCTRRDTIRVLATAPPADSNRTASICAGQSYTLPWGAVVTTSGTYRDTLRYARSGCDSLRRTVVLTVLPVVRQSLQGGFCAGASYTLPDGRVVNTAGVYVDTLRYRASGCDSLIRTVTVSVATVQLQSIDTTICAGGGYTLPWGRTISMAGVYRDTLRYVQGGCDSLRRTVTVSVQSPTDRRIDTAICAGQSYTLPWGLTVSASGTYRDTLRYVRTGCDSLRRTVVLTVLPLARQTLQGAFCAGASYTLPNGRVVNTAGVYVDTLRYRASGCDSVIRTVTVSVATVQLQSIDTTICAGAGYTLPWGRTISMAGVYRDTLRYVQGGCDSLRRTVTVTVQAPTDRRLDTAICAGQSYTLPWGLTVSASGTYRDTLRYARSGCDSVRRTVSLTVLPVVRQSLQGGFCAGASYTLPDGRVVNTAGVYVDTLRYRASGCDSVIRTVTVSVATVQLQSIDTTICAGAGYTLPWGRTTGVAGVYRDTLRYVQGGCDSVRRTVTVTVQSPSERRIDTAICAGQSYTLPWGLIVSASGTYRDTLRYVRTGCDSVRRTVVLTVQPVASSQTTATFCEGGSFTLPWGRVVSNPGVYRDTLRYARTGCDSLQRTVVLQMQSPLRSRRSDTICAGQSYTLPSGRTTGVAGVYLDTLRYAVTGCDSLIREVVLTVQSPTERRLDTAICTGQSYTLPWGLTVSVSGTYRDTLRYVRTGCDSVRRTVYLTVQPVYTAETTATFCDGGTFTLPWGRLVSNPGVYRDTLRYARTGCDSLRRTVVLQMQSPLTRLLQPVICAGRSYTLPWGVSVSATGVYRDTLRYAATGCDSLYRIVELTVQSPTDLTTPVTICSGGSYRLPWDVTVRTAGMYRDTLRYVLTGCDSLRRTVVITVTPPAVAQVIRTAICANEAYTLPWGVQVNRAGTYRDTLKTATGCDSLVRTVELTVHPKPTVWATKANDINCIVSTAALQATGALRYRWRPGGSLSDTAVANPVASPTSTTLYVVEGTDANGCRNRDSVRVLVNFADDPLKYPVPSAFTPNGDGLNDCFGVRHWGEVEGFSMQVYNRYGGVIYASTNPKSCWDGTYLGIKQVSGIYLYVIRGKGPCGEVLKKGTVTLIR